MTKPQITIRIGAVEDSVTVDGMVFDRSRMDTPSKRKLTRLTVSALEAVGYFK